MWDNPLMRILLALLAIASVGLGVAACGGSGRVRSTSTEFVVNEPIVRVSRELGPIDSDDYDVLDFGHAANAKEKNALVALTRRYYMAAVAEDGAKTCSMLYSAIVRTTVMEEYAHSPGLSGASCAAVMSKLLVLHHGRLVSDLASLKIDRVRTSSRDAYIVMRLPGSVVAHEFSFVRVGDMWKVGQPLDTVMR